jgi:hypothetical protein
MNARSLQSTLTLLANSAVGHAAEVATPLEKLPPAVQKTIRQTAAKGTITKTVKETEKDGTVLYEVAYTVGSKKFEAEVSPAGKLLVVDEQIALSAAPAAVQKVIKEKTAGGKIIKIEKATEGKTVFYEAEYTKGGKKHEVQVDPGGKILKTQ